MPPRSGRPPESVGKVLAPSGAVLVGDAIFLREPGEFRANSVRVAGIPPDRVLDVVGFREASSEVEDGWNHVVLIARPGVEVVESEQVGAPMVDGGRLLFLDEGSVASWSHERSLDGLADLVFWGKDAEVLATTVGASRLEASQFGWINLRVREAENLANLAERERQARGLRLALDLRPHSHHYRALAQARSSPTGSGCIQVGASTASLFFTAGDGQWPVFVDRGPGGDVAAIRIEFRRD